MTTFSIPYDETDRDRARSLLLEFVAREEFAPLRAKAFEAYSGNRLEDLPPKEAARYVASAVFGTNLANFVALEMRGDDGRTLLDRFLAGGGSALGTVERKYLEDLRQTRIGLYEVGDAVPGAGIRLGDLWSGESHWVADPGASRALVRWDFLAARLLASGSGVARLEGDFYPFLFDARSEFLTLVKIARRGFRAFGSREAPHEFFRGIAAVVHRVWLEATYFRPPPDVRTYEGDEVLSVTSEYEIRDLESLVRALDARSEFERAGDTKWHWKVDPAKGCRCRLGILTIEADRLVSETHSCERDARLRGLLEAAAREAIRRGATRVGPLDVPPGQPCFGEDEARIWLDHASPALGGRTPRQAARTRKGRRRLVEILKALENHEARAALAGRDPYDLGWLWAELGLAHPLSASPRPNREEIGAGAMPALGRPGSNPGCPPSAAGTPTSLDYS